MIWVNIFIVFVSGLNVSMFVKTENWSWVLLWLAMAIFHGVIIYEKVGGL